MPEIVVPRPSASVILVRDGPAGLETFMLERHARSRVAPSAYVFPGGTVRDDDVHDDPLLARTLSERSDCAVGQADGAAYYVAAIRELFEEAGVLLARDSVGQLVAVDEADVALQEQLAAARLTMQAHDLSLDALLSAQQWQAAFELLVPFSHWVTPSVLAARFDTRFFVARMPPRQEALHCTIETTQGIWIAPAALLDGDYRVVYATAQHLHRLAPFPTVTALLAFAQTKPIKRIEPEVIERGTGLSVWLPPEVIDTW